MLVFVVVVKIHFRFVVRGGVKNPRHGNFPLGGYPPPGASTDES